jgi:valyl-tRNA synthetase
MNGCVVADGFDPSAVKLPVNRWIATELASTIAATESAIVDFRFNDAANTLYRFTWNLYCDWYLELAKPLFQSDDEAGKAETLSMAAWVRDEIYKALHPIMPFITEELWQRLDENRAGALCTQAWPTFQYHDGAAQAEISWLIETTTAIRSARAEMNVPPGAKLPVLVAGAPADIIDRLERQQTALMRLARLETIDLVEAVDPQSVQVLVGETTLCLKVGSVIDIPAEQARLDKEMAKVAADVAKLSGKLGNENFLSRAPADVVQGERDKLAEAENHRAHLLSALDRLNSLR